MWSASPIWLYASMWACHQEPSLEGTHSKTTYSKCFFSSKGMSSSGHLFRVRWAPALRAGRGLHGFWMTSDWHGTKNQFRSPTAFSSPWKTVVSEACIRKLHWRALCLGKKRRLWSPLGWEVILQGEAFWANYRNWTVDSGDKDRGLLPCAHLKVLTKEREKEEKEGEKVKWSNLRALIVPQVQVPSKSQRKKLWWNTDAERGNIICLSWKDCWLWTLGSYLPPAPGLWLSQLPSSWGSSLAPPAHPTRCLQPPGASYPRCLARSPR